MKPVEDGEPVVLADYANTIEQERTDAELLNTFHDTREAMGPICAAPRVDPHAIARPAHHEAIAVVLDLMNPVRAGRRSVGGGDGKQGSMKRSTGIGWLYSRCRGRN